MENLRLIGIKKQTKKPGKKETAKNYTREVNYTFCYTSGTLNSFTQLNQVNGKYKGAR